MNTITQSSASGASGRPDPSQMAQAFFKKIDADNDGQVTEDEFSQALQKKFGTTDEAKEKITEAFKKTDSDGDGKLNVSEFTSAMKSMGPKGAGGPPPPPPEEEDTTDTATVASEADTNQDGVISAEELLADFQKRIKKSDESDSSKTPDFEKLIAKLDEDGDGSLSVDEFKSFLDEIKSKRHQEMGGPRYDQSGNGSVTDVSGAAVEAEA